MPGSTRSGSSSFPARSGRPSGQRSSVARNSLWSLKAKQILLLASFGTAISVAGLWTSGERSVSQPNDASHVRPSQLSLPWSIGSGGLARGQRGLAKREYQASRNRRGLQAPNRAHGFRTHFGPSGIRVHDRSAAGDDELLSLSLTALGRPERMELVGPGEVRSDGARVEIHRPGLVEW
jgi:hypothetical protein